jgi:hypothetical protein
VVTSVNRLVAARPYSAVHVEAPDPDIIMRRPNDLGKDHDPSDGSTRWRLRLPVIANRFIPSHWQLHATALAPSPQPRPVPTGRALPLG